MNIGGQGLGFKERPGLGSGDSGSQMKMAASAPTAYGSHSLNAVQFQPAAVCIYSLFHYRFKHLFENNT